MYSVHFKSTLTNGYIACLLVAFGTLRRSEICALDRKDVKGLSITVNKAMVQDLNDQWIIKPVAKNDSSNRIVEYPQFVINAYLKKENWLILHQILSLKDFLLV